MGLLQKLLGIDEGGYSETLWCYAGTNKHGDCYIPCEIIEEENSGNMLVRRKSDGQRFRVGVRDENYSSDYGWVTVFYEHEAEWVD